MNLHDHPYGCQMLSVNSCTYKIFLTTKMTMRRYVYLIFELKCASSGEHNQNNKHLVQVPVSDPSKDNIQLFYAIDELWLPMVIKVGNHDRTRREDTLTLQACYTNITSVRPVRFTFPNQIDGCSRWQEVSVFMLLQKYIELFIDNSRTAISFEYFWVISVVSSLKLCCLTCLIFCIKVFYRKQMGFLRSDAQISF